MATPKRSGQRSRIAPAVTMAILLSIAAIVAIFPQFRCQTIDVEGLRILDRDEVISATGLGIGICWRGWVPTPPDCFHSGTGVRRMRSPPCLPM